jgi:glucose dehydrogenase
MADQQRRRGVVLSQIIGGRDKIVHCINSKTGKIIWTFMTKSRVDSSPAIAGDRVYVGSNDGRLYTLDLTTGKQLGEFNAGAPSVCVVGVVVVRFVRVGAVTVRTGRMAERPARRPCATRVAWRSTMSAHRSPLGSSAADASHKGQSRVEVVPDALVQLLHVLRRGQKPSLQAR